ncbi:MAG TPA: hypothetical protein VHP11_16105 [Tepidisphaeraceae bacterium]|nr:hypothetical protein [Tepidisphaeraceae bacterium]
MAKPHDPAILHARVIYYSVMMQGQAGASVDMICRSLADWLRRFHPQDLPADQQALRTLVEPRLRDLLRAGRLKAHPEHPLANGAIVHYQGVFIRRTIVD